jgi:ankyrin repeat protein
MVFVASSGLAFCGEIHDAVRNGDLKKVKALLKKDPDLVSSKEAARGFTPLHIAAANGYRDIAEFLLAHGADVNAKNNDGWTPLYIAANYGQGDIAGLLLAGNADVNAKDEDGRAPLYIAVYEGHKDMAELLLTHGADVNVRKNDGLTPLHVAAYQGHKDVAELLLAHGADVNARSKAGSPLEAAEAGKHNDLVELLRQHGAREREIEMEDILEAAKGVSPEEMAKATHEAIRRVSEKEVLDAATNGDLKKLQELLQHDPTLVSSKDVETGRTPLHIAAMSRNRDMAKFLLAHGADVNAKGKGGETPLHYAATVDKDIVALLLASNADVNARDNRGLTPLHAAAAFGQIDIAELLLANKADVNAKSEDGYTPLDGAVNKGDKRMEEVLRQHGGHE